MSAVSFTETPSAPAPQSFYSSVDAPVAVPVTSYSMARHNVYEEAPADADRQESCCRAFWTAPFRGLTWLAVLYNTVLTFAWGLFTFLWVTITFCFSIGFFIFFPVGPAFMMFSMITWRALARGELFLYAHLAGKRVSNIDCDVIGTACSHDCSLSGAVKSFTDLIKQPETWKSVLYFILIKLWIAVICFVWTVTTLCIALALIFNFAVIASCHHCRMDDDNWGSWEKTKWIVTTYQGSLVTVPAGILMFCLSSLVTLRLAVGSARLAFNFLHGAGANHTQPLLRPAASEHIANNV